MTKIIKPTLTIKQTWLKTNLDTLPCLKIIV